VLESVKSRPDIDALQRLGATMSAKILIAAGLIFALGAIAWSAEEVPPKKVAQPAIKNVEKPAEKPVDKSIEKTADGSPVRRSAGYGSPATAKPLPTYPYTGYWSLSAPQLANQPGAFNGNVPLPTSVPQPVFPPQLNDMPNAPPFLSPTFAPSTTSPPGIIRPQSQR
jgi:hypothetical protein